MLPWIIREARSESAKQYPVRKYTGQKSKKGKTILQVYTVFSGAVRMQRTETFCVYAQ